MIMRQQDEDLDELGQAVGTLKQMGNVISTELDDQNRYYIYARMSCSKYRGLLYIFILIF